MALKISEPISSIEVVSHSEHNVTRINSIDRFYKGDRQLSKAPTFALTRPSPFGAI